MKKGYLSEYFQGVAAKKLKAVEVISSASNQHEFNSSANLVKMFGWPEQKVSLKTKAMYLADDQEDPIVVNTQLTWYDSRKKGQNGRKEGRLYYRATSREVMEKAAEGDLLIVAKLHDGDVFMVVAEKGSTISRQLEWLFGLSGVDDEDFEIKLEADADGTRIEFPARLILENIGIQTDVTDENYLSDMLERFKGVFPTTKLFSEYARSTLKDVTSIESSDLALMAWMEREELLFRTLERHLIADRLAKGFGDGANADVDVDGFLTFSLSVQNRRKSRVGFALENHLEMVFRENGILYSRTKTTENKSKPDFLFPGVEQYHDADFDPVKLTMLGVKSTCKDRWRQVLAEADRIPDKHLLTLEPSISTNQTDEMRDKRLQLVIPVALHNTYTPAQQGWLISVEDFTLLVKQRQSGASAGLAR